MTPDGKNWEAEAVEEIIASEERSVNAVTMRYAGHGRSTALLKCEFLSRGQVYAVRYKTIWEMAKIWSFPPDVREYIFHWAKMLNNPD